MLPVGSIYKTSAWSTPETDSGAGAVLICGSYASSDAALAVSVQRGRKGTELRANQIAKFVSRPKIQEANWLFV